MPKIAFSQAVTLINNFDLEVSEDELAAFNVMPLGEKLAWLSEREGSARLRSESDRETGGIQLDSCFAETLTKVARTTSIIEKETTHQVDAGEYKQLVAQGCDESDVLEKASFVHFVDAMSHEIEAVMTHELSVSVE